MKNTAEWRMLEKSGTTLIKYFLIISIQNIFNPNPTGRGVSICPLDIFRDRSPMPEGIAAWFYK